MRAGRARCALNGSIQFAVHGTQRSWKERETGGGGGGRTALTCPSRALHAAAPFLCPLPLACCHRLPHHARPRCTHTIVPHVPSAKFSLLDRSSRAGRRILYRQERERERERERGGGGRERERERERERPALSHTPTPNTTKGHKAPGAPSDGNAALLSPCKNSGAGAGARALPRLVRLDAISYSVQHAYVITGICCTEKILYVILHLNVCISAYLPVCPPACLSIYLCLYS